MHPEHEEALEKRVVRAAEAALAHKYVSAIDVFTGMGLLAATHVEAWRRGRIDFLERVVQGNLKKISASMAAFRQWAQTKGSGLAKPATCAEPARESGTCNSARAEIRPSRGATPLTLCHRRYPSASGRNSKSS